MKTALFVAWRNHADPHQGWGPVGRLEYEAGVYRFFYTQGARTLPGFRAFSELPDLEEVYESTELFPLFANRLLSKQRPEYERFLQWGGFSELAQLNPLFVLGVTEGKKATDSVEVFPCPLPDTDGCYFNRFFAHGLHWAPPDALRRIEKLKPGDHLKVILDVQNQYDRNAVAFRTDEDLILLGYVPRYLAADVWELFFSCDPDFIHLTVAQVNRDAPLQQRLLCQMQACWPDDFQPCSGAAFQPIPNGVSALCAG